MMDLAEFEEWLPCHNDRRLAVLECHREKVASENNCIGRQKT